MNEGLLEKHITKVLTDFENILESLQWGDLGQITIFRHIGPNTCLSLRDGSQRVVEKRGIIQGWNR